MKPYNFTSGDLIKLHIAYVDRYNILSDKLSRLDKRKDIDPKGFQQIVYKRLKSLYPVPLESECTLSNEQIKHFLGYEII